MPQIDKLSLKNGPKSDHKSTAEIELERLEGKLRTVQLALEILTGACATLPDPEPDVDGAVGEGDDEEDEGVPSSTSARVSHSFRCCLKMWPMSTQM